MRDSPRILVLLLAVAVLAGASLPCPPEAATVPGPAHAKANHDHPGPAHAKANHDHPGRAHAKAHHDHPAAEAMAGHHHHGAGPSSAHSGHAAHHTGHASHHEASLVPDESFSAPCPCGCQESPTKARGGRLGFALARAVGQPAARSDALPLATSEPRLPEAPVPAGDFVPI